MGSTLPRDGRTALPAQVDAAPPGQADAFRVRRADAKDARRPRRRKADARPPSGQPVPIGETLLAAGLIDRETLAWALDRQAETGERIGQILLAAGRVHRLDLQRALGEQWRLPFIDLLTSGG